MPKSRDFNCSFDVKHIFIAQFISKLQAKTPKINILIFHDFVKTGQNVASYFQFQLPSKWHLQNSQTFRFKNLLLNFTNCILKKATVATIINETL